MLFFIAELGTINEFLVKIYLECQLIEIFLVSEISMNLWNYRRKQLLQKCVKRIKTKHWSYIRTKTTHLTQKYSSGKIFNLF